MRIRAESILPGKEKELQVLCAFCFEDANASNRSW